jgi:hypothetical protein
MSELAKWDSFYVIVGSAAGALIGLQFVVMTLIAERPPLRASEASAAFATPTIVHFSVVLLISALLQAPWETTVPVALLSCTIGVCGIAYIILTARRMRLQTTYKPEFEDWLFHVLLPLAAYVALALSAIFSLYDTREAMFVFGGAMLLLLFSGIHNAWDAVAYHVLVNRGRNDKAENDFGAGGRT